jgi:hypothetical protein
LRSSTRLTYARGQRRALVAVLAQQMVEVPGAVADVDLRVVQVGDDELRAAGVHGDALRSVG